jgi:hypothetical protein
VTNFLLESMTAELVAVSVNNDLPIQKGNNWISYSEFINQEDGCSLSNLHTYAKNIYYIGYVSQDGACCHMIHSDESHILLEMKGIFFPLWSNTALKLSCKELTNRCQLFGSCCWLRVSTRKYTMLQYTLQCLLEKNIIKSLMLVEQRHLSVSI